MSAVSAGDHTMPEIALSQVKNRHPNQGQPHPLSPTYLVLYISFILFVLFYVFKELSCLNVSEGDNVWKVCPTNDLQFVHAV
jgi:hypothetical protein